MPERGALPMTPPRRNRQSATRVRDPATERLIRTLVAGCGSPAVALELYYWSREPGLIEVIRGIATMPEETKAVIEAFIALARDARSVSAALDARGVLTLASAEAAKTVALAHRAAEDDAEDAPRLLN
jgi:hypothetical protein